MRTTGNLAQALGLESGSGTRPYGERIRRTIFGQATLGFLLGYLLLHPVSMVIFRLLDPSYGQNMGGMIGNPILGPLFHSFTIGMLPMGLAFAVVSAIAGGVNGYYRSTILLQRDDLAQQANRLTEQNLRLAELEEANRRNTRFMVHDFKNHLACIVGFSDRLLRKEPEEGDEERVQALSRIRRQAYQMLGAVSDLLDFAGLKETYKLHAEEITVSELITESVTDCSIPEHEEQVSVGPMCKQCPPVWGDSRLLRRVLTNLVSNALKHNPAETRVTVDAEAIEGEGKIVFSCRDNGRGVPAEELSNLFGEFRTGRTESRDATGLGLAFCKLAVEAHGGSIWCESGEGRGACFLFSLPLER